IGGDEFALLLPQTDAAQALGLSRRIEAVFAETVLPLQLSIPVTMDHGVATYPQDGEQPDHLFHVADDRLYRLKHSNHGRSTSGTSSGNSTAIAPEPTKTEPTAGPQPISIESRRTPEKPEVNLAAAVTASAASLAGTTGALAEAPRVYAVQRKAERVSMTGTNAYAVLGEQGNRRARVLDLGFGGVGLELDSPEQLPETLLAVLHVPILPPVRVSL